MQPADSFRPSEVPLVCVAVKVADVLPAEGDVVPADVRGEVPVPVPLGDQWLTVAEGALPTDIVEGNVKLVVNVDGLAGLLMEKTAL